jgi:tetratricopeptide (TPR) repeat protein
LFARIGGEFNYLSIYDSALSYNLNALKNFKLLNFKRGIGVSLTNLASTYSYLKNNVKAIQTINEAIKIRTELGDEYAISILKNNLTNCLIATNKYDEALKNALECEVVVKKQNEFDLILQNALQLKNIYFYLGDYKKACIYSDKYVNLKDTLFEKTNLKTLNELQTKYETDKKEKEISILQLENKNASQKAIDEKKRRNIIFLSILFFTMLIAIFTIIIFKRFKKSQKQKRIIEKQKQLVDEKQKEIIDSILYAKRIQQSLLPTEKYLERIFKNRSK